MDATASGMESHEMNRDLAKRGTDHLPLPLAQLACLTIVMIFLCLSTTSLHAETQGIRLQGKTQLTGFDWSGKPFVNVYDNFTLDMDRSGKWLMTTYSSINTNGYIVSGYDGTNVFMIMYSSRILKSVNSTEVTEETPYEKGIHSAAVSNGEYPFDLDSTMLFSWFALISGQTQYAHSDRMPAPWLEPRTDLLAYSFRSHLSKGASWPMCLTDAEFVTLDQASLGDNASLIIPNDETSLMLRREQEKKVKDLPSGLLASRFAVQQSTNYLGLKISTVYTLDLFWPGVGVGVPNTNVAQRFSGMITNIVNLESAVTGRPEIIGDITVRDFRFKYSDAGNALQGLRYKITDHKWKDMGDPELQRGYKIMKSNSPRFNNIVNRTTKWIVLLVLAVVSLGPVLWLFCKRMKS